MEGDRCRIDPGLGRDRFPKELDRIRVLETEDTGVILSVEQHEESIAYFHCAIQSGAHGWRIECYLREQIRVEEEWSS